MESQGASEPSRRNSVVTENNQVLENQGNSEEKDLTRQTASAGANLEKSSGVFEGEPSRQGNSEGAIIDVGGHNDDDMSLEEVMKQRAALPALVTDAAAAVREALHNNPAAASLIQSAQQTVAAAAAAQQNAQNAVQQVHAHEAVTPTTPTEQQQPISSTQEPPREEGLKTMKEEIDSDCELIDDNVSTERLRLIHQVSNIENIEIFDIETAIKIVDS